VILQRVSSICPIESIDNSCDGSKLEDVGEEATTLQEVSLPRSRKRQNSIFNGLQVICIPPRISLLTLILYITTADIFMHFVNKKFICRKLMEIQNLFVSMILQFNAD
jgi:hypothetical protein